VNPSRESKNRLRVNGDALSAQDRWPHEFRKLVTIGASMTAGGWSTARERCWASLLAAMISDYQAHPVELFNAGLGANCISPRSACYAASSKPSASERLEHHVIAQDPDLLIFDYALVDARGGTPVEVFAEELTTLVRRVRARIAPLIVLLGPFHMTEHGMKHGEAGWDHATPAVLAAYNETTARVASQEGCLFVDVFSAFGEADWLIHYDNVHLNDIGHRVTANAIFDALARSCSGLTQHTKEIEKTSPRWRNEAWLQVLPVD
jgi:lysophospholipase L1-like esterase